VLPPYDVLPSPSPPTSSSKLYHFDSDCNLSHTHIHFSLLYRSRCEGSRSWGARTALPPQTRRGVAAQGGGPMGSGGRGEVARSFSCRVSDKRCGRSCWAVGADSGPATPWPSGSSHSSLSVRLVLDICLLDPA
jgi:hypothetical protein